MRVLSDHRARAYKEVMDGPFAFVAVLPDCSIPGVQGVLGLDDDTVFHITASTMGGRLYVRSPE